MRATHESRINELESNLKITEISYQISEINFATTNKVRKLWLIAISIAFITLVIQFLGIIFMPENFVNYYLADFLFLIAIFVIFFISYRYPQSFLLSKNHVIRAFRLYAKIGSYHSSEKQKENLKLEQIQDYLVFIRQYVNLDSGV